MVSHTSQLSSTWNSNTISQNSKVPGLRCGNHYLRCGNHCSCYLSSYRASTRMARASHYHRGLFLLSGHRADDFMYGSLGDWASWHYIGEGTRQPSFAGKDARYISPGRCQFGGDSALYLEIKYYLRDFMRSVIFMSPRFLKALKLVILVWLTSRNSSVKTRSTFSSKPRGTNRGHPREYAHCRHPGPRWGSRFVP
jgi:hypothetical protein